MYSKQNMDLNAVWSFDHFNMKCFKMKISQRYSNQRNLEKANLSVQGLLLVWVFNQCHSPISECGLTVHGGKYLTN